MASYQLAHFDVRAEVRDQAERAMHELAAYIHKELPGSMWTAYCDPAVPTRFWCLLRTTTPADAQKHRAAPGVQAFEAALARMTVSAVDVAALQLVTSSDLAPRHRRR